MSKRATVARLEAREEAEGLVLGGKGWTRAGAATKGTEPRPEDETEVRGCCRPGVSLGAWEGPQPWGWCREKGEESQRAWI